MPGLFARWLADEAANMATLFALVSPVLIGVAAFAVDEASLHLERRQLQSVADLAAIHAAGDPQNAEARIATVLSDFGYTLPPDAVTVTPGRYSTDPAQPAHTRFMPAATPANAVSVALTHPGQLHFASIFNMAPPDIGVSAIAAATPRAAYSIGSRLASLNGGVLNAVLGGLLGTELSLSLVDYQAIASLDIELLDFLDALAGHLDLTAGTYGDLLASDIALSDIAIALSGAAGGNAVLLRLAGLIDDEIAIEMARLIAADGLAHLAIGTSAAIVADLNALQLLSAAALVADGNRHITLGLGANVPGLVGIDVALVIGEPPQGGFFTLAGEGSYVRTAQTRLRLDLDIAGNTSGLGLLSIRLPVYAELAPAEARLAAVSCPPGRPEAASAILAVTPGTLRLAIGHTAPASFLDTDRPLVVNKTPLVSLLGGIARVNAHVDIAMAQTQPVSVGFTHADIAARTVRTVSTTTPLASLTGSLLGNLDLELEVLRLNLLGGLLSGATGAVRGLIAPVIPALDQTLIALFDVLGLGLGQADLRIHGFDCRNAALVG
ncbi:TadG family pilus assembly protein [Pelagibacterium luteolum]|uniref:Uncharacterized membrane protein n=1 Tax=Pelagibacterium luteolum TaxID=440168 RepID=A0A1G7SPR3_9HYPH|nr:TadG family pilus assembly protein [Pelagibacterium luteolum]SDG24931.1 Uncharacterized membrane protein [Pelagibacterium luteolum]